MGKCDCVVSFSLEVSYLKQGSSEIEECGVHCREFICDLNRPGSLTWPLFLQVVCSSLHGCGPLFILLLVVAWNSGI